MPKKVITCIHCDKKMRVPKYKHIKFTCPKCGVISSYDGKLMLRLHLFGLIGSILLVFTISYLVYFGDYFKYLDVKNNRTEELCKEYYEGYPEGYFIEEVKVIEIEITKDINLVRDFIENYPKSEYNKKIEEINNNLWVSEISRYDSIVNSSSEFDAEAIKFFKELLLYMRDKNIYKIGLNLQGEVNVQNFDKYDISIQEDLNEFYLSNNDRNVTDNIIKIEDQYNSGNIKDYEEIINKSIQSSFENIFSKNFIQVISEKSKNMNLSININYYIANQEDEYAGLKYPHLWYYGTSERFISHLIGVSIKFDFNVSIPGTERKYGFQQETTAKEDIPDIPDLHEGYYQMTKQNFQLFAKLIATKFGINRKTNICDCKEIADEMNLKLNDGIDLGKIEQDYFEEISDCQSYWNLPEDEYYKQMNECQ